MRPGPAPALSLPDPLPSGAPGPVCICGLRGVARSSSPSARRAPLGSAPTRSLHAVSAGASLTNGEAEPLFVYPPAAGTSPREKRPSGPPAGPQPGRPRPSSRCRAACVSSPRALGPGPFSGAPFANVCAHPVTRSMLCGGFLFLCRAKARRNFTAGEITTDIYFLLNSIRKPFRAAASGQVPPRVGARRERNGVSAPIDRRPRPLLVDVSNLYNKPVLV